MTGFKIKSRKLKNDYIVENDDLGLNNGKSKVKASVLKCMTSKNRKIRMSMTMAEERKLDKEVQRDDNMSIGLIVLILVLCFVVGISLGYLLYNIALNGGM